MRKVSILIFMSLVLILPAIVNAYPSLPTEFYGSIIYYNDPGVINNYVRAYDQSNNSCGNFYTRNSGYYGVLSCKGDDNDTVLLDEGADVGETIRFSFKNEDATALNDATYTPGAYKNVTLIVPKLICGDMFCQRVYETCATCQIDCGVCSVPNASIPPNQTNQTTTAGGGGGGEAGGASDGGSGGGGGATDIPEIFVNLTELDTTPQAKCKESWNCTDWSECYVDETHARTCNDINKCNSTNNKPHELEECMYEGNCFDNIMNGKEKGIDCGGACRPCPGFEGDPNCFDGIKNCHDGLCEGGIDCGGVCALECEKPKRLETPIRICNKPTDLFRTDFLLLYILVAIFTIAYVVIEKEREHKIKKDEKLKDIDKARKYLLIEKSIILFVIFVILLLASVIMYYVFFFCSKNFYEFIKFVIPAFLLIPVVAFFLMRAYEYDEKERKEKLAKFLNTHHEHIKKLMRLQNDYLNELEVELSNDIYQLSKKDEFKDTLERYAELKIVYRDMIALYDKYKEKKTPYGIEKELCEAIKKIEDDENFKKLGDTHTEIKIIYDKLATLYTAYEEKNELYKELIQENTEKMDAKDAKKNVDDKK